MEKQTHTLSRRTLLKGLALAGGASALSMPYIRPSSAATTLRVSNFGGFFEEAFVKSVYPAFTKATGIELQSVPQSGSAQFLIQMAQAKQAGSAPMDVCIAGQADVLRGRAQGLWQPFDKAKLPNLANIIPDYNFDGEAGLDGVGAMAWYISLIANPAEFETLPDSWTELWKTSDPKWGLQSGSSSVLLEIAAGTYFGGTGILDTEEGIDKVIAKIAELKPNVKLWWADEGSMQTAYQNDEIVGGMYFHDVSQIMKSEGTAVESIFPKEGAVLGFNAWALPVSTTALEEAHAFVNWSCSPECHQLIARNVYAAPLIERSKLDLTDEEFAKVGAAGKPIVLAAAAKVKHADYMSQQFLKMVTA
jgi:putative spermidine/putrescine transport system substrate-binding protein